MDASAPRTDAEDAPAAPAAVGPTRTVTAGGVRFTLLGTAHVSRASADEVRERIASGRYDAVAIELDAGRHAGLVNPDAMLKTDLFTIFRQGKAGAMAANLALGAFQQRLADQYGIEPGQEMRDAVRAADQAGLPLWLVDRDIGVTLRRVYRNVPWWRRIELMAGLAGSVLTNETIDEDEIERLKEGDILEATFSEFAETSDFLYQPLIAERDAYMATRLRQEAAGFAPARAGGAGATDARGADAGGAAADGAAAPGAEADDPPEVLVVLGAGHLKGVAETLAGDAAEAPAERLAELERVPPPNPLTKALPWLLVALVVSGFVIGFLRDPDLGAQLVGDWFWINATTTGLGLLAALAHPVTLVLGALAAPFTSLNPLVGAGFVAAALELWRRKPAVGDFASLRRDVTTLRGWYGNRVARTLLVFFGATLGSAIGTYVAGARILTRLF